MQLSKEGLYGELTGQVIADDDVEDECGNKLMVSWLGWIPVPRDLCRGDIDEMTFKKLNKCLTLFSRFY